MQNLAVLSCKDIIYLDVNKILPSPYQPRKSFDKSTLTDLAKSIKSYGVMQPLSVRYLNRGIYELVAGERRLKAAKLAGLTEIPAIVVNVSDKDSAVMALVENIQRENLGFFEEAEGFQSLMVDFGYTQEEIAGLVGKGQSTVSNKLRTLRLDPVIKGIIVEEGLTERHARALLKLDDVEKQKEALNKVIKYDLNVSKTEELIESMVKKEVVKVNAFRGNIKGYITDIRIFTNTIKNAVDLMKEAGVATEYEIVQSEDGYEIKIKVAL